ncbi:MAG: carbamoyltransferase C-terminal domain-containing protein [Myxococcota bacterium]
MIVLGFHGGRRRLGQDNRLGYGFHDATAVVVRDGDVVAAVEDERLTRVKHGNYFPERAIRAVLDIAGVGLDEVDAVANNWSKPTWDFESIQEMVGRANGADELGARTYAAQPFLDAFGVDVSARLHFVNHHIAHARSTYACSGFERALVVVIDGGGDGNSGMVFRAHGGGELERLQTYTGAQSLGDLYRDLICLLGYRRFDEYKVMGLAPYGDPSVHAEAFASLYELKPEGAYEVAPLYAWVTRLQKAGVLADVRHRGEAFTEAHRNIAAAIQATLETLAMHIVDHFREATGERHLCLAGGVAHNSTFNGRLLASGEFDGIFVQPASHDAGGALGAALEVCRRLGHGAAAPRRLKHAYLGPDVGDPSAEIDRWAGWVHARRSKQICADTAALLHQGKIVGWVQGRSEFGPRALGHRSILADPREAGTRDRVNRAVKLREGYRPFAPAVTEAAARTYFEIPEDDSDLSFMGFVAPVREPHRPSLGAVTHVDGTARVQVVREQVDPRFHGLLEAFGERSGMPVVLNTSFNNAVEPIVQTAHDAMVAFLTTELDALVIGEHIIEKREVGTRDHAQLVPSLTVYQELVKRGDVHRVGTLTSPDFKPPTAQVSVEAFAVLSAADGQKTIAALVDELGLPTQGAKFEALVQEMIELWRGRCVCLVPASK